jgi:UDP-N-acetylmuramoyl-L-alanyl-D-glutamate--2,6-diaminopimelate ligase
MKNLESLIIDLHFKQIIGDTKQSIEGVGIDSRIINKGFLFIAIKGSSMDGHEYIGQAIENGAKAVCCESLPEILNDDVVFLLCENSAKIGGELIASYYGNPSRFLNLVGVTGTNGKTSVCTLLYQMSQNMGLKSGLISTVQVRINEKVKEATHTTPDPVSLHRLLKEMLEEGCEYVYMEVSSHACDQDRISGLEFTGGVFTNMSHDHLDYHKSFEAYIKAKKKFFDSLDTNAFALINIDDKRGQIMLQNCKASHYTYALRQFADFKGKIIDNSPQGLVLDIESNTFYSRMTGEFNGYNLLCAYGTAVLLGLDKIEALAALSKANGAEGRMELVFSVAPKYTVFVDYAHTPDALENVLKTIKGFRKDNSKLIVVIGCGGNRDKSKRPIMGNIASKWSERVIFTADNPRNEETDQIIEEMMAGVEEEIRQSILKISDRATAIQTAMMIAEERDIILIAGKGHEKYQEIKGIKYPFDDKQIVENIYKAMRLD